MSKKNFFIYFGVSVTLFLVLIFGAIYCADRAIDSMDGAKIEYKLGFNTELPGLLGGWKEVYWRVSEDELKWYLKPFNQWHKAYFVSSGYVFCREGVPDGEKDSMKYTLFNTEQFTKLKNECHTVSEMKEHNRKADKEYERWNYNIRKDKEEEERLSRSKKMWEDAFNI